MSCDPSLNVIEIEARLVLLVVVCLAEMADQLTLVFMAQNEGATTRLALEH